MKGNLATKLARKLICTTRLSDMVIKSKCGLSSPLPDAAKARESLESVSPRPNACLGKISYKYPVSCDLSVIVPVYNVEKYVGACLDSILNQKVDFDMEVIIVNDGSTDGSRAEVERRACSDSRIVVIDQVNKGLSGARNAAIDISKGSVLCFVDSDDMLAPGHVQALWDTLSCNDVDFVSGTWSKMTEEGKVLGRAEKQRSHGAPWARLYRREVWNDIRFPEGFLFEDTVQAYCISARFTEAVCDNAGYLRRTRRDSITATASTNPKSLDSFWVVEEMLDWCESLGIPAGKVYEQTISQFGPILMSRTRWMDEDLRRCLFACCSQLVHDRFERPSEYAANRQLRYLEQSLWEGNYELWKAACKWS